MVPLRNSRPQLSRLPNRGVMPRSRPAPSPASSDRLDRARTISNTGTSVPTNFTNAPDKLNMRLPNSTQAVPESQNSLRRGGRKLTPLERAKKPGGTRRDRASAQTPSNQAYHRFTNPKPTKTHSESRSACSPSAAVQPVPGGSNPCLAAPCRPALGSRDSRSASGPCLPFSMFIIASHHEARGRRELAEGIGLGPVLPRDGRGVPVFSPCATAPSRGNAGGRGPGPLSAACAA